MCNCGCNTCETKPFTLNESLTTKSLLSEGLRYCLENEKPLTEHVYRAGSEAYFNLWAEARALYSRNLINITGADKEILTETDLGHFGMYENKKVPLDFIFEAEYRGREVELNKPKRGGSKKFFVYVRDPKSKKIKRVEFGAKGGGQQLSVKLDDPVKRKAFSDRHNCPQKNDKTKPSYWSCRLPRYWKSLGGSKNYGGFW
jgi:hypothetical protein